MKPAPPLAASGPKPKPSRYDGFWPAVLIVLAGAAAYANSLSGPFIFDDLPSITDNQSIRHLGTAWQLPHAVSGVSGRPAVNFSLAVNYAFGGMDVRGYHALNLAFHICSALTLFGIVRRTLNLVNVQQSTSNLRHPSRMSGCVPGAASAKTTEGGSTPSNWWNSICGHETTLGFFVALLWAVHPLLTESVTCVVQRTESQMALFYLLTLYCFVRAVEGAEMLNAERRTSNAKPPTTSDQIPTANKRVGFKSSVWIVASVAACFLGMASKEVMVSAPLIVLLYDRTFVAGTFWEALRQRWRWHLMLAATWLLLAYLVVAGGGTRGNAAGFGLGVMPWNYALTQCQAILQYLKLSIWPSPLILDYGTRVLHHLAEVWWQASALALLLAATIVALWRYPALGFVGAWFFAILSPSSSVIPLVAQTVAEHRMYLPLAAVVVLVVLGLHGLLGRRSFPVLFALTAVSGWLTYQRNETYRTDEGIWRDTVAKCPNNERAHFGLGGALALTGRLVESEGEYLKALRLKPNYFEAYSNLGNVLSEEGRKAEAIAQCEEALRLKPDYAEAHNNLGSILNAEGRTAEAIAQDEEAVKLKPDFADAHNNLGSALNAEGHTAEAIAQCEEALRLKPDYAEAHNNLGNALFAEGLTAGAIAHYEEAVRLKPDYAEAHDNLGIALKAGGRMAEAIAQCEEALRLKPDLAEAHKNLGDALNAVRRTAEAIAQYEEALRLKPDYADAHINLGNALSAEGRTAEAIAQDEEAVRLKPDSAEAHNNLGSDLSAKGRTAEAIAQYEEAVRLKPDLAKAHKNLGEALNAEGRTADAIAQYEEAVRLKPDYAEARNNLGNALSAAGRTAEAIAQYEEAVRLLPDVAPIHFNLALALLKVPGRTDEAATHLEAVLRLQPDNDLARKILASIAASGP